MRDYEPDVSQILALYQQLEDDVIASMTKRMLKMGKVSESTKYEAEILQTAGLVYEDILELTAQRTDATKQHVKALFEDAGVQTVSIDNQIHKQNSILPVDIRQDASLLQILEAGYKKTLGMMRNLVSTTANLAQTAFISACDRAYMQVSSGAFSYQQAIRQAVKSFGDTGAMVQYPSGHRDRIDVAVRRAVLTGVGQTSASVALQHAKDSDCKFMELTAHSGARPDHAAWQGQLVSLDGKSVGKTIDGLRVFSLDQIGYGTGAGFKGWNCRHNWHPYYVGLSTPNYTPEQLKALDAKNIEYNGKFYTEYEISQMQRAAERKVRALKRQVIASQTALENAPDDLTRAELQTDYTQNAVKLKKARKALQEFCKQTGRRNDTFRTQVEGFGRSQAQKAVWADKKAQKDLTFSKNSGTINLEEDNFISLKRIQNNIKGLFTKSKNVELLSKTEIENAIKEIGFKSIDDSFFEKVDIELQISILEQLKNLENQFQAIHRADSSEISSENIGGAACVRRNPKNCIEWKLILSPDEFKNKKQHISDRRKDLRTSYCMPCCDDDETLSRYIVTHEYGHILENMLIAKDLRGKMRYFEKKATEYRKEITNIAKTLDPNYTEEKYLSKYAREVEGINKELEFFAECFANSQLGQPNILGKAMIIWLERREFDVSGT